MPPLQTSAINIKHAASPAHPTSDLLARADLKRLFATLAFYRSDGLRSLQLPCPESSPCLCTASVKSSTTAAVSTDGRCDNLSVNYCDPQGALEN
jgi:hypothetical protein